MKFKVGYGLDRVELEVADDRVVWPLRGTPRPALTDPAAAVRDALENPHDFPALRRALTPDDHVTVVLDDRLPRFLDLLRPVLEHIVGAGVEPRNITLLSPTASGRTGWVDDLPDEFEEATLEVHDPTERRKLAYLATTKAGRRIYLNRSLVDADQTVVLTGRRYHPWLGVAGGEMAIFPALSDEATLKELAGETTEASREALRNEAVEVAWLLGVPFLVQLIEGSFDTLTDVLAGPVESSGEGRRLLEERWRVRVDRPADVVVATLTGSPGRHDFADLAAAAAQAAKVVRSGGRIVLLSQATPGLQAADVLQQAGDPEQAVTVLQRHQPLNSAARQWAEAARQARIYLLSGLAGDAVEQIFATPLEHVGQAQKLLTGDALVLEDAHNMFTEFNQDV